jgi:cleavage and polyadenylation specificity factor subunit 5
MKQNETELECLKRKLDQRLAPEPSSGLPAPEWKIVELAGVFYRPNFEASLFPYQVPHVSETKEIKKLFVVTIGGDCVFEFPANYGIELVSLMDLLDNSKRFGPVASSIPLLLSRFQFVCLDQQ